MVCKKPGDTFCDPTESYPESFGSFQNFLDSLFSVLVSIMFFCTSPEFVCTGPAIADKSEGVGWDGMGRGVKAGWGGL